MCGIFGKVSLGPQLSVDTQAFRTALDLLHHRGPDNGATYFDERVAFGHRRLSIIDLSHEADQPMVSADGRLVVVFNGEIYNFREIRERLSARGRTFRTEGDTEVLLEAFAEQGPACVQQFIGMFAFAIHDRDSGETFLFRDRLGIKPLYYHRSAEALSFASEPKSILQHERIVPHLNKIAVSSYLSFRYPVLNDSFFEDIASLPPAHYLHVKAGSISLHCYWNPVDRYAEQAEDRGESWYIDRLRDLLSSAVRYRMISDVPSGAFLSGGVDSSVLTALMAQASSQPVKTFTIGFAEDGYNEFNYASLVANRYATQHREITLSGTDYLETMARLISYKDAPLSVPNEVPLYLMSRELKKDITVVLSGEGADELFGGYGRIFRSTDDYARAQPAALAALSESDRQAFLGRLAAKYGERPFDGELDHFLRIYGYTSASDRAQLLHADMGAEAADVAMGNRFSGLFGELGDATYFDRMNWAFLKVHIVGLLNRVDVTTMAASVEGRVPFLDHRIVEFSMTIPQHYKLRWNSDQSRVASQLLMSDRISEQYDTPKYLLKKAFEPDLPHQVLYRRKMGFPVPLGQWFGGNFLRFAREVLLSPEASARHIFDRNAVEDVLVEERLTNDSALAQRVWMMINVELFSQRYMRGEAFAA